MKASIRMVSISLALICSMSHVQAVAAPSDCSRVVQETSYWGLAECYAFGGGFDPVFLQQYVPPPGSTEMSLLDEWIGDTYFSCYTYPPNTQIVDRLIDSCATQSLYISNGSGLHSVNKTTGKGDVIDATPSDPDAMASLRGFVYEVVNGQLNRVDVTTGAVTPFSDYPTAWQGTQAMTALGDSLYIIQLDTLYRVHANGAVEPFSNYPTAWQGTEAMAATGDSLYIVQNGTMYRVRNDGAVWAFGDYADNWAGTKAMAAKDGVVYGVQEDALWSLQVSNGSVAEVGNQSWPATSAMVAR